MVPLSFACSKHVQFCIFSRATDYRSYQSSVTCNGPYRRHVIELQPSFHDVEGDAERKRYVEYGALFSAFKHYTDLETVRSRSTLKDRVVNERIFRNLFRSANSE